MDTKELYKHIIDIKESVHVVRESQVRMEGELKHTSKKVDELDSWAERHNNQDKEMFDKINTTLTKSKTFWVTLGKVAAAVAGVTLFVISIITLAEKLS